MNRLFFKRLAAAAALLALGAAGGLWWSARLATAPSTQSAAQTESASAAERQVLYWYDPMVPAQHFDKPGKSPFMDMELVPKYADDGGAAGVSVDPDTVQNLGMRTVEARVVEFSDSVRAAGTLAYDERAVAVVQARAGGYVERVAPLAPGDVVRAGAFIAELLVPQWAAAQQDYLALKATGDTELAAAAVSRMRLAGMPDALIRAVERNGTVKDRVAIVAPIGGALTSLDVRAGMTLAAGQTLARINGLSTVWLDTAVPQAQAQAVRVGQRVEARLDGFPGAPIEGRVIALLPALDPASRTLVARIALPNRDGRLRPGLSAEALLSSRPREALAIPAEAVIRDGARALVLVAGDGGRYRPAEVALGRTADGKTEVLSGLAAGERVVVSGQFLIDSEASLSGVVARTAPPLHEADALIRAIDGASATLEHGPFESLDMMGMTMDFPLARPELARGLKPGDRVRVGVRQTGDGLVVEKLDKTGSAQ